MEVNILQSLTEYIAMMVCLYRLSGQRPTFKVHSIIGVIINFVCVLVCMYHYDMRTKICAVLCIMMFAKYFFGFTWKETVKYFGLMLVIVTGLQLLIYLIAGNWLLDVFDVGTVGLIENCIIIFVFMLCKSNYFEIAVRTINRFKEGIYILVFALIFFYFFYTRNKTDGLNLQIIIQTLLCLVGIVLVITMWLNTEKERKQKAEELRTYELYTKSYEETISAIRMKQHEFKNHINAILCMQYTIEDEEERRATQTNYCREILNDNCLNDLLRVEMSPVIIGYLYSKFTSALERGIPVKYDIQDISLDERISVHDLVELIGILFDNAVEALEAVEETYRQIYVGIGVDERNRFYIEVANASREYGINEMEAFFAYGNSTKGEGRGVGLYQAKKLAGKYKGVIDVNNVVYDGRNYIRFKVLFQYRK